MVRVVSIHSLHNCHFAAHQNCYNTSNEGLRRYPNYWRTLHVVISCIILRFMNSFVPLCGMKLVHSFYASVTDVFCNPSHTLVTWVDFTWDTLHFRFTDSVCELYEYWTNSMEQSPPWEVNSCVWKRPSSPETFVTFLIPRWWILSFLSNLQTVSSIRGHAMPWWRRTALSHSVLKFTVTPVTSFIQL
jgi:hypothetical protein